MKNILKFSQIIFALGLVMPSMHAQAGELSAQAQQIMQRDKDGDPSGTYDLGVLYMTGTDGVTTDKAKAVQLWEKSAAAGYGPAMFNLGSAYAQGDGVEPDLNKALAFLKNALEAYQNPNNTYPQKEHVIAEINVRMNQIKDAMKDGQP